MPCGNWSSALRHLVADGILDGRSVVEGRVTLDDLSRSNEVAMLSVDGQAVAVVKRRGLAIDEIDPLVAEVDCLRWLAGHETTAAITPVIVAAFDDIVATSVVGSRTLSEALHEVGDGDDGLLWRGLGRSLAVLHSATPDRTLLVPRRPWVLGVVDGVVPATIAHDPGIEALVERVESDAHLVAAIRELDESWTTTGAIHGDIKFDNIMVPDEEPVLVDWELAGLGPAVWDLAGVAVSVIVPLILVGDLDAHTLDHSEVRRTVAPVLDAYQRAGGALPVDAELATATVVRLVQTAFQLCAMRHDDEAHQRSSMQVFDAATALAPAVSIHGDLALIS